jgi:hypothetical protein
MIEAEFHQYLLEQGFTKLDTSSIFLKYAKGDCFIEFIGTLFYINSKSHVFYTTDDLGLKLKEICG